MFPQKIIGILSLQLINRQIYSEYVRCINTKNLHRGYMKNRCFVLIICVFFLVGCESTATVIKDNLSSTAQSFTTQASIDNKIEVSSISQDDLVIKEIPNITVVKQLVADVDNDGVKETVFIFTSKVNDLETTRANLCVVKGGKLTNSLDLSGGDTSFTFAFGPDSLKFISDPSRISVILHNAKTDQNIDFRVTIKIDSETMSENFKIETIPYK
jgi:hypothetical protein